MPGPPPLRIAVDAGDALNELGRFSNALDRAAGGFDTLNKVVTNFNKKGEQVSSVVTAQIAAFETVTQVIDKNGKVVQSTYEKNDAAARRFAANQAAAAVRQDKADEARAAKAAARFDADVKKRNDAIDREMERARKAKEKAEADAAKAGGGPSLPFTETFNRLGRNLTQFASFRAFHFIAEGIMDGVKAAKEFQVQISLIRTISQDTQQSFQKFGRDIRGVSDTSGFDIKDVGKAFYDTTSNQVAKGANVAPFVKSATDLARVTGSELPDSVNLLSSAINAYGLSAADAERISAVFFRTIDEGRIVSSELANTFGRVAVLGSNLGVPLEDLNAILAITTQKGLKTSDAMTLLTNLLIKLEKPTESTAAFFKSLGVETGEQAVAMYGLIPLVNKMVAAVKSGKIDVSAFFDEIRGRKQFGIFEQSGGEIQAFSDKLKNTSETLKNYKEAIAIRGESPADALNKELNKLSNIFKVDLGQAIVQNLSDFVSWAGGVDRAKENAKDFGNILIKSGQIFAVFAGIVITRNIAMAVSFRTLGLAALGAAKYLAPFLAGYYIGQKLFASQSKEIELSAEAISGTTEKLEQMRVAYEKFKASQQGAKADPLASFAESKKNIGEAYKTVLGLLSQATIVNNKFLDDAKSKSKETADALKTGFGTYTDIFHDKISKIKKDITDAKEEIKRSAKSLPKFNESLDEILFNRKEQYANDDFGQQKIQLAEQRLGKLYQKKDKLLKSGTEEDLAEMRKVYDEIAQHEDKLFGLRTDYQKKQFERYLEQNPDQANRPGGNIFSVDVNPLDQRLQNLAAMRAKDEAEITKQKKEQVAVGEKLEEKEKAKLRNLETAIKNYDKIELFTKEGKLNPDFADASGRLDRNKYNKAISGAEADIRAVGGPTFEQRVALESLIVAKRKAGLDEVNVYAKQEDLKTTKTQILNDKDTQEKKLEDLKKNRDENLKAQEALKVSIFNKSTELAAFAQAIGNQSKGIETQYYGRQFKGTLGHEDTKILQDLINQYTEAAKDLYDNPIMKDGIPILDPKKAQKAYDIYSDVLRNFDNMAKKYGLDSTPSANVEGGGKLGPDAAREAFKSQLEDLRKSGGELFSGVDLEKENKKKFEESVTKPLESLKTAFPDLSKASGDFTKTASDNFKSLTDGGVEQLRLKLLEINKLLEPVVPAPGGAAKPQSSKVGFNDAGDDSGYAYAASGGIVGMFPGQPRGVDRYPIWAAKGERIIDAQTSSMYAPMLDAIMSRRMPQYMAGGGIVGGDTHVGDINITVNGAKTNSDTARAIGQHLERQLRLNNIRLEKK